MQPDQPPRPQPAGRITPQPDGRKSHLGVRKSPAGAKLIPSLDGEVRGSTAGPATDDVAKVAPMVCAAERLVERFVRSLLHYKHTETELFPAQLDRQDPPSVTVSAMAMLALHHVREPQSQFTCSAVLNKRMKKGGQKGAWPPQAGSVYHVHSNHWALYATLRLRPSEVAQLGDGAQWLISQRSANDGGWGHTKHNQPRPYHTAHVLNALLEYTELARDRVRVPTTVLEGIRGGVEYLRKTRNPLAKGYFVWNNVSDAGGICIATTLLSLKALVRYYFLFPDQDAGHARAELKNTLEDFLQAVDGKTLSRTKPRIKLGKQGYTLDLWPSFHETAPNYFHHCFTPGLIFDVLEVSRQLELPETVCLLPAVTGLVSWVLDNAYQMDGHSVMPLTTGNTAYVWSTAQALLALAAWKEAAATAIVAQVAKPEAPVAVGLAEQ